MSNIEHEELHSRINGMEEEELVIAEKLFLDDILWGELYRRYMTQNAMVMEIKSAVKEN